MSEGVKRWGDILSLENLEEAIPRLDRASFVKGNTPLGLVLEGVGKLEIAGKLTTEKASAERKRLRKLAGQE